MFRQIIPLQSTADLTFGGTDVVAGCGVQFLQFLEVTEVYHNKTTMMLRCWLLVLQSGVYIK
jgi:hypothetical protein